MKGVQGPLSEVISSTHLLASVSLLYMDSFGLSTLHSQALKERCDFADPEGREMHFPHTVCLCQGLNHEPIRHSGEPEHSEVAVMEALKHGHTFLVSRPFREWS